MSSIKAKHLAASNLSLPADTYIYTLARLQNYCAAISSDDSLTYFDPTTLKVLQQAAKAHEGITCLEAALDTQGVVTAGRDGLIKFWDDRAKEASLKLRERTLLTSPSTTTGQS